MGQVTRRRLNMPAARKFGLGPLLTHDHASLSRWSCRRFKASQPLVAMVLTFGPPNTTFQSVNFGHPDVFVVTPNMCLCLLNNDTCLPPLFMFHVQLSKPCKRYRVEHDDACIGQKPKQPRIVSIPSSTRACFAGTQPSTSSPQAVSIGERTFLGNDNSSLNCDCVISMSPRIAARWRPPTTEPLL